MTTKTITIDSIEQLNADSILFVCSDEYTAKALLKRNPRASVQRSPDTDAIGLVYSLTDCNLLNAVKRA
jgi:predicted AlkP superfamily pyrophosphatase or phosphodiesterase